MSKINGHFENCVIEKSHNGGILKMTKMCCYDLKKMIKTNGQHGYFFWQKNWFKGSVYIHVEKLHFLHWTYNEVTKMAITQSILELEH